MGSSRHHHRTPSRRHPSQEVTASSMICQAYMQLKDTLPNCRETGCSKRLRPASGFFELAFTCDVRYLLALRRKGGVPCGMSEPVCRCMFVRFLDAKTYLMTSYHACYRQLYGTPWLSGCSLPQRTMLEPSISCLRCSVARYVPLHRR
jgi:hypothetical protein